MKGNYLKNFIGWRIFYNLNTIFFIKTNKKTSSGNRNTVPEELKGSAAVEEAKWR